MLCRGLKAGNMKGLKVLRIIFFLAGVILVICCGTTLVPYTEEEMERLMLDAVRGNGQAAEWIGWEFDFLETSKRLYIGIQLALKTTTI